MPDAHDEAVRAVRANPGPGEHAMVDAFNAALVADPIPV